MTDTPTAPSELARQLTKALRRDNLLRHDCKNVEVSRVISTAGLAELEHDNERLEEDNGALCQQAKGLGFQVGDLRRQLDLCERDRNQMALTLQGRSTETGWLRVMEVMRERDALQSKNERLKAAHNGEVCVDVQEYCDRLKADNPTAPSELVIEAEIVRDHLRLIYNQDEDAIEMASARVATGLAELEAEIEDWKDACGIVGGGSPDAVRAEIQESKASFADLEARLAAAEQTIADWPGVVRLHAKCDRYRRERDSLRLELQGLEQQRLRENEHLISERDEARGCLRELVEIQERANSGDPDVQATEWYESQTWHEAKRLATAEGGSDAESR